MGLINCPDCGKSISDIASSCIQCGRPMILANSKEPLPKNGDNNHLSNEHVKKIKTPPSKMFKILAGVFAVILGVVLAGIISAATGDHRPHNMAWTFLWIWLTIVSCREIGLKAFLYYPAFLAISISISVFANSIGSVPIYIAGNVLANILGLILFYTSYSRAIKSYSNSSDGTANKHEDNAIDVTTEKLEKSEIHENQIENFLNIDQLSDLNKKRISNIQGYIRQFRLILNGGPNKFTIHSGNRIVYKAFHFDELYQNIEKIKVTIACQLCGNNSKPMKRPPSNSELKCPKCKKIFNLKYNPFEAVN